MRALLIYESMYANTRIVANCVAEGLRERHAGTLEPAARPTSDRGQ